MFNKKKQYAVMYVYNGITNENAKKNLSVALKKKNFLSVNNKNQNLYIYIYLNREKFQQF